MTIAGDNDEKNSEPHINPLRRLMRRWVWPIAFAILGFAVLVTSSIVPNDWTAGLLVNFGTTVFLFAPLAIVGNLVQRRFDEVQRTQLAIEHRQELTEHAVADLGTEIARSRTGLETARAQLEAALGTRIAAIRENDEHLFQSVELDPSHDSIIQALTRADDLGLISSRGCRFSLTGTDLYLRFTPPRIDDQNVDPNELLLQLEKVNGESLSAIEWEPSMDAATLLLRVGQELQALGSYPGDKVFMSAKTLTDLCELLEFASSKSIAADGVGRSLGRVIELCPPQWAITETGIISTDRLRYSIPFSRLQDETLGAQMSGKQWVDMESFEEAQATCLALLEYRQTLEQWSSWGAPY